MRYGHILTTAALTLAMFCTHSRGEEAADIGRLVADGVGEVRSSWTNGNSGPVYVFEENHTSRIGQHQIAVMLLRLHDKYGLRLIGLEGAVQAPQPIDAKWFHLMGMASKRSSVPDKPPSPAKVSVPKENVALRMLGEGEISSAEFLAMVCPDVQIYGLEKAEEYNVELDSEGDPTAMYLLRIAELSLTQADIRRINDLASAGKQDEAVKIIKDSDPWVRDQFQALQSSDSINLVGLTKRMREIRAKAESKGISVGDDVEAQFDRALEFFETASRRSVTMVTQMTELVRKHPGQSSAMIIGSAHSGEIKSLLQQRGVSYVLLRPLAMNSEQASLTLEQFDRKNKKKWARNGVGAVGRLLNRDRKPAPFIETTTAQSYASALYAAQWMAGVARRGGRLPDDVREPLSDLPECIVHFDTIQVDGFDVIFQLTLKAVDGQDQDVWVRSGSTAEREPVKTMEQRLLQQISDLGYRDAGNAGIPPNKPPVDTTSTADAEGPGDGKRKEVVIARVSDRVVAAFTGSADEAAKLGRISG